MTNPDRFDSVSSTRPFGAGPASNFLHGPLSGRVCPPALRRARLLWGVVMVWAGVNLVAAVVLLTRPAVIGAVVPLSLAMMGFSATNQLVKGKAEARWLATALGVAYVGLQVVLFALLAAVSHDLGGMVVLGVINVLVAAVVVTAVVLTRRPDVTRYLAGA